MCWRSLVGFDACDGDGDCVTRHTHVLLDLELLGIRRRRDLGRLDDSNATGAVGRHLYWCRLRLTSGTNTVFVPAR